MLPLYETQRAYESLKKFKVPFNMIVINKVITVEREIPEIKVKLDAQEKVLSQIEKEFKGVEITKIPMFPEEPRGLEWLEKVGGMVVEG
jgi:arsenite-transporting ATPase